MIKVDNNTLLLIGLILCCLGCTTTIDACTCAMFILFCLIACNFITFEIEINSLLCCVLFLIICCGSTIYANKDIVEIKF
jgi:Na+-transporting NADH:ubiquinone oxidoreductase subunit NqrB